MVCRIRKSCFRNVSRFRRIYNFEYPVEKLRTGIPFSYIYPMRTVFCFLFFIISFVGFAQNQSLARNYFKQGEFEKSLHVYERLLQSQPGRQDYLLGVVQNLQELERFEEAENHLRKQLSRTQNQPQLYVELGHNYTLQNQSENAEKAYRTAIESVVANPNFAFSVGRSFREYNLLDYAIQVFETAMKDSENLDFNNQLAQIYGEQGNLEKMFETYLDILEKNPSFKTSAQRYFSNYISEDPENEANTIFRRSVLRRSQKDPDILYNELLSWFFIQQKEFEKAFTQEKAIFRRSETNDLNGIVNLANIAINEKSYETAREIVEFLIEKSFTQEMRLQANQVLMEIEVLTAKPKAYPAIEKKFENLFQEFGTGRETYLLQIDYNHFLAFKHNKKEVAIENLRRLIKEKFSAYEEARIKMELADILVFDEKFNQALIYYSQIQSTLEGHPLAQEARFKVARTSYFKGDFEWAQTQLDVLKKSTSQLIANDAMKLSLLIKDNSLEDSTQTALKKYARADLLELQEKNPEAIALLEEILQEHKHESIEDEALLKQGRIYEKTENYQAAEANYLKILEFHGNDILADEALFYLAQLYETKLNQPEEAKKYYERIIFEHEDSIFFVESRRKYRMLRGDAIN